MLVFTFSAFLSPQSLSYLQLNTGQVGGSGGSDLNVEPAWIQGITGKGVVVAVVDDGELYACSNNGNFTKYNPARSKPSTLYFMYNNIVFETYTKVH